MKLISTALVTLAATLSLTACGGGGTASGGNEYDLATQALKAMERGDYAGLVALCSPDTRAEASASLVFVKAFDPKGDLLKAEAADLKADLADGSYDDTDSSDSPPVKVNGKWYLDCNQG